MNKYQLSNGQKVTQSTINKRLSDVYKRMDIDAPKRCQACGKGGPLTHDHSISQKRCKELGHTELIWDEENIWYSCHKCHNEWESYKSGKFMDHKNSERRLELLKIYDPEGYKKRTFANKRG